MRKRLAIGGLVCLLALCMVVPAFAGISTLSHGQKWLQHDGNYCVWTWRMKLQNHDAVPHGLMVEITLWDKDGYEIWKKVRFGTIGANETVTFSNRERTLTSVYEQSVRYNLYWEISD